MKFKLSFLLILLAALAAATPLTVKITGVGSGTFGSKTFTAAQFTVILTADTSTILMPPCCPSYDLAQGSPTTVTVQGLGTATVMDTQSAFVLPNDSVIGLAHFNGFDLVDLQDPALSGYKFGTSIGPLTGVPVFVGSCPGVDCSGYTTSVGPFNFSSVSTVTFQVTIGAVTPPAPVISKIVDVAAKGTTFSPGMPVEITGMNFGNSLADAATITIGGKSAPILTFVSSSDVIAQIPVDAAVGATTAIAAYKGANSAAFALTLANVAPVIYVHTDTGSPVFYDSAGNPISSSHLATANSEVYLIAAGLGPTNPAQQTNTVATAEAPTTMPVQVMVGNLLVTPDYAGLFVGGMPGTYKVQFKLPTDVAVGSDTVTVLVGGQTSNTASLAVGPPVPSITAIVNGATFQAHPAAPNSFVSIFGANFGSKDTASNIFPATNFNDVSVLFNGVAAPLYFVFGSIGQINLVLPSELPETGPVNVQVKTSEGTSATFILQMGSADVGMFRIPDPSNSSRKNGAVLFGNTVWRVMPASMAAAIGFPSCAGLSALTVCGQPASAGDNILIFMTGLGLATPNGDPAGQPVATGKLAPASGSPLYRTVQTPTVTVGGIPATAVFSGISPGNAGLYQINLTIPDGVPTGDDVPVVVTMPGGSTDTVTIAIRAK